MGPQIEHYIELIRSIFNDKKVILLEPILAIAKERLRLLRQVGALPPLVLTAENISYEPTKDLIAASVFALVYRKLGLVGGQFESAKEL